MHGVPNDAIETQDRYEVWAACHLSRKYPWEAKWGLGFIYSKYLEMVHLLLRILVVCTQTDIPKVEPVNLYLVVLLACTQMYW